MPGGYPPRLGFTPGALTLCFSAALYRIIHGLYHNTWITAGLHARYHTRTRSLRLRLRTPLTLRVCISHCTRHAAALLPAPYGSPHHPPLQQFSPHHVVTPTWTHASRTPRLPSHTYQVCSLPSTASPYLLSPLLPVATLPAYGFMDAHYQNSLSHKEGRRRRLRCHHCTLYLHCIWITSHSPPGQEKVPCTHVS